MRTKHSDRVVAQFGSALDWGSRGRWFESSPPDQIGELAQLGERVTGSHEVRGSNPLFSTTQCQDSGFIPESFLFRFSSCLGRSHPKSTNGALQTPPNVNLGWERRRAPEITVKISLVANHNRLVWIAIRMLVEEGLDDACCSVLARVFQAGRN